MDSSQRALQTNEMIFQISFLIIGRKPNNIQTNSIVAILIKVQCVIYQWI